MQLLTEEQYEQARDLFLGGLSSWQVCQEFLGVGIAEIRRAICAVNYQFYINSRPTDASSVGTRGPRKLTASNVREIHTLRTTLSQTQLAELFGVSACQISYIHSGRSWKHLHPNYEANKGENRPTD